MTQSLKIESASCFIRQSTNQFPSHSLHFTHGHGSSCTSTQFNSTQQVTRPRRQTSPKRDEKLKAYKYPFSLL